MGRRSRKSKRRMNSLFMTLVLTAIMLIMSTYAWFSANRQVEINGITAKVRAAEGLQISLDGENWDTAVTISKAKLVELGSEVADKTEIDDTATTTENTWSASKIQSIVNALNSLTFAVVSVLPTTDISTRTFR